MTLIFEAAWGFKYWLGANVINKMGNNTSLYSNTTSITVTALHTV